MHRRIAARLLTGPGAFLLAGLIDVGAFAAAAVWDRARRKWQLARFASWLSTIRPR